MSILPLKPTLRFLIFVGVLTAARIAFYFFAAVNFVYPQYDFGQKGFSLLALSIFILVICVFAIVLLFQRRIFESVLYLMIGCAAFLSLGISPLFDAYHWKFAIEESSYLSQISRDQSRPPQFRVFNWGNENTSIGGGYIVRAVVYDEADEIALAPEARSAGWIERREISLPEDRWVTAASSKLAICNRSTRPLGGHFYYLQQVC